MQFSLRNGTKIDIKEQYLQPDKSKVTQIVYLHTVRQQY